LPGQWTLTIGGLATPSPRVVAHIIKGSFDSLTPTGAAAASTTCPSGHTCCSGSTTCHTCPFKCPPHGRFCEFFEIRWFAVPFPIPPEPPCRGCPDFWKLPFREGFERVLVSFNPLDREGKPMGVEKLDQIKVNVKGGSLVGSLVDMGEGRYAQMVEHATGEPPRVSASAMGITTPEVFAGTAPSPMLGTYRTLTFLFAAALVLALGGGAAWMRRRGLFGGGAGPRA
jgi:hypothetical protein